MASIAANAQETHSVTTWARFCASLAQQTAPHRKVRPPRCSATAKLEGCTAAAVVVLRSMPCKVTAVCHVRSCTCNVISQAVSRAQHFHKKDMHVCSLWQRWPTSATHRQKHGVPETGRVVRATLALFVLAVPKGFGPPGASARDLTQILLFLVALACRECVLVCTLKDLESA